MATCNKDTNMSCECYQIGGRFIAEDPDCAVHGHAATQAAAQERQRIGEYADQLDAALDSEDHERIEDAARQALGLLRELS